jgi:uncharacterized membrane protein
VPSTSRTPYDIGGVKALGSVVRSFTLAMATLTTGLMAGVYFAYSVSVNLGPAAQPDTTYVATMNVINDRIENPLFFASFFGAAPFPLLALAAHYSRRSRSGRFWLVALACVLAKVRDLNLQLISVSSVHRDFRISRPNTAKARGLQQNTNS